MRRKLLRTQRIESELEHEVEQTRTRERVKHRGKRRGETFGKFPHVHLKEYDIAGKMTQYIQGNHLIKKPKLKNAEPEENWKKRQIQLYDSPRNLNTLNFS